MIFIFRVYTVDQAFIKLREKKNNADANHLVELLLDGSNDPPQSLFIIDSQGFLT